VNSIDREVIVMIEPRKREKPAIAGINKKTGT